MFDIKRIKYDNTFLLNISFRDILKTDHWMFNELMQNFCLELIFFADKMQSFYLLCVKLKT